MQGIIHLSYSQARYLESLFEKIIAEQTNRWLRYQQMVANCLEEALINLERIMADQFRYDDDIPRKHKAIIENVLKYIDANFQNPLNFNDIAAAQNLSPNYFRKIFKTYTGTSPVDHLNRIRVLKALELLREHKTLTSSEVAGQVGIYDANYFTRLSKKYTGFPPSHFSRAADRSGKP
jgi:YesN/AraC family two-component response regulator